MRLITFLLLFSTPLLLAAQSDIPNPGFENWQSGGGFFNGYNNPVGWQTLNSETNALGVTTTERESSSQYVRSGQYALKLRTRNLPIVNEIVPGLCSTGSINIQTESVNGGTPFNERPEAINGWYQYYPQQGDTGQVGLILTRWNFSQNRRDTIGVGGFFALETTPQYAFFSGSVTYSSDQNPDTMLLVLVSSSRFSPRVGSTLYLDDLSLEYGTTNLLASTGQTPKVYPNPVRDQLFFEVDGAEGVEIIDQSGRVAHRERLSGNQGQLSVADLINGQYLLRFFDSQQAILSHARIVVAH